MTKLTNEQDRAEWLAIFCAVIVARGTTDTIDSLIYDTDVMFAEFRKRCEK